MSLLALLRTRRRDIDARFFAYSIPRLSRIDGAARAAPIADASDDAILTDPNQRDLNDRNEIDASRSFRVRRTRCAVVVLARR